jgi:hypothetical protein
MLIKLTGGLLGALILYIAWQRKQHVAKKRLRDIDEGRRCIACDRTSLEVANGHARCLACGHVVLLASLQAAVISESEIAAVTKPDDRSRGMFG